MAENPGKSGDSGSDGSNDDVIVIRKYANRRLYNTATGEFVTLEDLRGFVTAGQAFVVIDVKTDQDITSSILAQIIADQEARGEQLLPDALLRQIIEFYEKGMPTGFDDYLKNSMEAFSENWADLEKLNEMGRQNMEIFQKSMASMFGATPPGTKPKTPEAETKPAPDAAAEPSDPIADQVGELQEQLRVMQEKLDRLEKEKDD